MFTQVEIDYLKSLINTYREQGYKYYLAHTVTERNNEYDIRLYVSKEEITATTDDIFSIKNAVVINIDSSSRNDSNNSSIHSRDVISNSNYNGVLTVHTAEFIYTNAVLDYSITTFCVNPDIMNSGVSSYNCHLISYAMLILVSVILLYMFIRDLLRFGR